MLGACRARAERVAWGAGHRGCSGPGHSPCCASRTPTAKGHAAAEREIHHGASPKGSPQITQPATIGQCGSQCWRGALALSVPDALDAPPRTLILAGAG